MLKKSIYLVFLFFVFGINQLSAQEMPAAERAKVDKFKLLAEKYLSEGNENIAISNYNKAAYICWENEANNEAIELFNKSLELVTTLGNKNGIRVINNNLANIYNDMNNLEKALYHFKIALEVTKEMGNKERIIESLNNVAVIQRELKQYNEAIVTLKESLSYALELKENKELIRACYSELANNYEALGDIENTKLYFGLFKSFDTYVAEAERLELEKAQAVAFAQATAARLKLKLERIEHELTRDSLNNIEALSKEQLMQINLLNQAKKIDELKLKNKKAEIEKAKREKHILWAVIAVIFVIFMLLFFQFRAKKNANKLLAEKNTQLEEQKNEISMKNLTLRDLNSTLKKQKDEITAANKELAKKNNQIEQSIVYASKIQEAILPSQKAILLNFPESFIFYRPRDIVSGDFYWFSEKEGKQIIAAVDCTGHSVPGAFMSMIGNTLLNEIVNEKNILHPANILDKLHYGIVKTLNSDGENEDAKDGMDITLCVIDKANKELEIAAANHSVFIITDGVLHEIEGDIFSIGDDMINARNIQFTNHIIALEQDTSIYLMSDGYQDQFGGKKNSKFMKLRLKNLLVENQHLSLKEQGELVASTFDEWKGKSRQIDDVLLIGLKIEIE